MKKGKLEKLVIIILGLIVVVTSIKIIMIETNYHKSAASYDEITKKVKTIEKTTTEEKNVQDEKKNEKNDSKEKNKVIIDFNTLEKINSQAVGWITIDGTVIDYPIAKGEDNQYYLNHSFDKEESSSGAIFVDKDCKEPFSQFLTIVYGHHMRNGTMFADIKNYGNKEYAKKHSAITVYKKEKAITYQVFAAVSKKSENVFLYLDVSNDKNKENYIDKIKKDSIYWLNEDITAKDEIIALVTCDYGKEDGRMIVYGVKEKGQE